MSDRSPPPPPSLTPEQRVTEFVQWVLDQHTGTIEGCDIEEKAVELGLMTVTEATESCGEGCVCTEYGFPATCYRPSAPSLGGSGEG
jgi:hypothetical protein